MSQEQIQELISSVRAGPSSFYSDLWGDTDSFSALPYVSRADLVRVPLSRRRYKDERAFVKIVRSPGGWFLSEWSFEDIMREPWGIRSKRPMAYLSDPHESIEKSIWCYDAGMVPLIGEQDVAIASYAASKYEIDQLITDADTLGRMKPYLEGRGEKLEALTVIGSTFDLPALASYVPYARTVRCILALPETGALAEATLQEPVFIPRMDCVLEHHNGELVVTKLTRLVTPVIKYQTGILEGVVRI